MQRKTTKKEAWRPKSAALRRGYEQNQKATYYCFYLGRQNEVTFVGGISECRPKSEPFLLLGSFVFVVLYRLGKEGGKEEGGYYTRRRKLPEDQVISCCYMPGITRHQVADGRWREEGR